MAGKPFIIHIRTVELCQNRSFTETLHNPSAIKLYYQILSVLTRLVFLLGNPCGQNAEVLWSVTCMSLLLPTVRENTQPGPGGSVFS